MAEEEKNQDRNLRKAITNKTVGYITAALGLVTGLAWNEAIKALIDYLFPITSNSVLAKFIYAAVMTAVVVVFSIYLVRIFKKEIPPENK